MKLRWVAAVMMVVIVIFAATALPVFAHAELLRSTPEPNAVLAASPGQIDLWFTEALEPSFSEITVLDTAGARVDNADSSVDPTDPTHLTVSLRSLAGGVYTMVWKVLSTVDSHVTAGAFPFAIGEANAAELAAAGQVSQQVRLSIGEVLGRWLIYLSTAMLAGGALFVVTVWQPAFRVTQAAEAPATLQAGMRVSVVWRRLATGALAALGFGSLLVLLTKAGQASGVEIAAPWTSAVANLLFNTRYGLLWMLRFTLALVLTGLLLDVRTKRQRWAAAAVALLVLLTVSMGSHAAGEPQPVLPVLADWLHMAAAAVWVGGLTHFVASLWLARHLAPPAQTPLVARLIPRFSALAAASVGVLGVTGLYSAWLRVGSLSNLAGTFYGQMLVFKTALALPLLVLGAVNLLIISPRMRHAAQRPEGNPHLLGSFWQTVRREVVLGVMLLFSVGVLTSVPPAQVASGRPGVNFAAEANDLTVALNIVPGRVGINTFTVTLHAADQPVTGAREVALRFTPAVASLPPSEAVLVEQGAGAYRLQGAYLSLPDNWQVQVVVRREGQFDAFANFNYSLAASSGAGGAFPWHMPGGLLLLVAGSVFMFSTRSLSRALRRPRLYRYGVVAALALTLSSFFVFYFPDTSYGLPINPIPPNAASIAAGQALYQANCVPCHGASGKGDGPVGLTLNPRPADLTVHTAPGVHPDGRLYDWITNGFPGNSVMPAFRTVLSDEERWHVVNYIRTLNVTP